MGKTGTHPELGCVPVFPSALAPQSSAKKAGEEWVGGQAISYAARPRRKMDELVPQDNLLFSEVMRSLPPVRGRATFELSVRRIRGDYGSAAHLL